MKSICTKILVSKYHVHDEGTEQEDWEITDQTSLEEVVRIWIEETGAYQDEINIIERFVGFVNELKKWP